MLQGRQQTSRKSSRQRLDNLPMDVGIERVHEDMLDRRRARIEQMEYIGMDMRSESGAQSRANKAIFEETLSTGGQEAVVRAVLRKCLPASARLTGPTFYGSPLYNKRTQLMASIRARPSGWPPVPMFRGRPITFGVDQSKSPLDVSPVTYAMPHTVRVPLPVRRNQSLRPICSKYQVAIPADDVEHASKIVQTESPSLISAQMSLDETVLSNTIIVGAAVPVETDPAASVLTPKVDTVSPEVGKRPFVSEKSPRGRSTAKGKYAMRQKDSMAKDIVSTTTMKESIITAS